LIPFFLDKTMPLKIMSANEFILSASLPPTFMIRCPSDHWWRIVEEDHENAPAGTRFLVRRDRIQYRGRTVIMDYLSTRVDVSNFHYGNWSRQYVAYYEGEPSPYPAT
jgi:hypothetical protein